MLSDMSVNGWFKHAVSPADCLIPTMTRANSTSNAAVFDKVCIEVPDSFSFVYTGPTKEHMNVNNKSHVGMVDIWPIMWDQTRYIALKLEDRPGDIETVPIKGTVAGIKAMEYTAQVSTDSTCTIKQDIIAKITNACSIASLQQYIGSVLIQNTWKTPDELSCVRHCQLL